MHTLYHSEDMYLISFHACFFVLIRVETESDLVLHGVRGILALILLALFGDSLGLS